MKIAVFLACVAVAMATPKPKRLIVGGEIAPAKSRPYQVALLSSRDGRSQFCGGTLVHQRWVVTAAHCADNNAVYVGLGFHDLRDTAADGAVIIKGKWIVYPYYNSVTDNKDMALIQLEEAVTFSDKIQPISIVGSGTDMYDGARLLVSGWGTTIADGPAPFILRQVVVSGITRTECSNDYYYTDVDITYYMICTKSPGRDSCQGDSGGPLVRSFDEYAYKDGVELFGIVSFGIGCADPYFPGVYTRVSKFCWWIESTTSDEVLCK